MTEIKPRKGRSLHSFMLFYLKLDRDQMHRGETAPHRFQRCKNMLLHLSIKYSVLRHAELKLDLKQVAEREVTVSSGSKGQL